MKTRLVVGLAAVLAVACVSAATAQVAPCTTQVEGALKSYGLTLAQMQDPVWHSDFFANSRSPEIGGYQFEGRPPSCHGGKLVIELWRSCRVSNTYASGACNVERVSR